MPSSFLNLTNESDGNIRYFEYQNDKFEFLSEYKSGEPQRGIAFLPKRGVNIHENEVMRAFKTVNDSYIEPISFIVPRRAEVFQDDIFPPPVGSKPAMSAGEWFDGKTALPPKIDLASVYAGEEAKEVPSDFKPLSTVNLEPAAPSPIKKTPETKANEPSPSTLKGPPPSMNQQTASIKDLAQKFNDEEEGEEDDASSFEDVAKPLDRSAHQTPAAAVPSVEKSEPLAISRGLGDPLSPIKGKPDDFDQASQLAATQSTDKQILSQQQGLATTKTESVLEQLPSQSEAAGQDKSGGMEVKESLAEIKSLLEEQRKTMHVQNDTIGRLTAEVDRLRSKMGEP